MINLSLDNYISFLSSNAQIFGALIGLLGLTFVRISETIEENVGRLVSTLVRDFMSAVRKNNPEVSDLAIDVREFASVIEKYKTQLGDDYEMLKSRCAAINIEVDRKKEFKTKFILNCWVSLVLIILSMLGLLIPFAYERFLFFYTTALFAASIIGVYLTIRFYLAVANTTMILAFDSDN